MKVIAFVFGLILCGSNVFSQSIKFDQQRIAFYRYPLKPLDKSIRTYSAMLQELNANLSNDQRDSLKAGLVLPGYHEVTTGGDVQLELIISPLSVTNKEIKDQPLETEKDGKKSVVHQYWYEIKYAFPAKVRLVSKAQTITELDLPGFFTTEYYPQDRSSLSSLQKAYDTDFYFLEKLKYKRVEEVKDELRKMLASQFGYGMTIEFVDIGYIKDKKGEYDDLTKAMSILHEAFAYANNKKEYQDDFFTSKVSEAIVIYEKALLESSEEKKARIDPFVTGMVQYNLALSYYGLTQYDKASEWYGKIRNAGRSDGSVYSRLSTSIDDKRNRMIANGLIAGQVMSEEVKPIQVATPAMVASAAYRNFIVGAAGDTLDVQMIIPSKEVMPYGDSLWMQDQVNIISDGKAVELRPSEIRGYSYQGVFRESVSWAKDMSTTPWTFEKKFCKRVAQGTISVYSCYATEPGFRDPSQTVVATTMWYRKGDVFEKTGFLNFNKGVSKLVADHVELADRVKNGAYQREDFVKVIKEYNQWKKGKM